MKTLLKSKKKKETRESYFSGNTLEDLSEPLDFWPILLNDFFDTTFWESDPARLDFWSWRADRRISDIDRAKFLLRIRLTGFELAFSGVETAGPKKTGLFSILIGVVVRDVFDLKGITIDDFEESIEN